MGLADAGAWVHPEVVDGSEDVEWAQPWERGRPRPPPHALALRDRSGLRRTFRFRRQPWDARGPCAASGGKKSLQKSAA